MQLNLYGTFYLHIHHRSNNPNIQQLITEGVDISGVGRLLSISKTTILKNP
jgi:hypothetical protein